MAPSSPTQNASAQPAPTQLLPDMFWDPTQNFVLSGQDPRHVVTAWGCVVVVQSDGSIVALKEKPLATKLELLFNKNLYVVALSLAHSEQVGPC